METSLPTRTEWSFIALCYPTKEEIARTEEQGYHRIENTDSLYGKEIKRPMYSAQVHPKHIGDEPNYGQSVHEHCYYTHYYEVKRSEYEAMEVKPQLEKQYRAPRYHNFDGFVDKIQEEKQSLGWKEVSSDFHKTTSYVYFVVD